MLAAASLGVVLPVLFAAVAELRVIEMFYIILLDVILGAALLAAFSATLIRSRLSRGSVE